MTSRTKVLVLDIGEAPYALAVARSLGAAGMRVHFGFPVGSPRRPEVSRFCSGAVGYPDPSYAREEFQARMLEVAPSFDFIVPAMEATLLGTAQVKAEIESAGAVVPVAGYDTLLRATNKLEVLALAKSLGLHLPRTVVATTLPSVGELPEMVGLPFVMKSSSEIGLQPIDRHCVIDRLDEASITKEFDALAGHGPVILQEYVSGIGAGTAVLFSRAGHLVAYTGHRRLFEQFSDGGPSLLAETRSDPDSLEQSQRLLSALHWAGVAMVEFRLNAKGVPVFMEINPRFWGTITLAIASGVDFPRLLIESFGSTATTPPLGPNAVRRYFSVEGLVTAATSPPSKRPKLTSLALQLARSWRGLSVREFQGRDLRPVVAEFLHYLEASGDRRRYARLPEVLFGPALEYSRLESRRVRTVIDLREPAEIQRRPLTVPSSMTRIPFPIPDDTGIPPDRLAEVVSLIDGASKIGAVYVHCRLGMGRAPMVATGFIVSKGTPLDEAFGKVYRARPFANPKTAQKGAVYLYSRTVRKG